MTHTQEQLEGMGDFEINKEVASLAGYLVKVDFDQGLLGFTEKYHREYPSTIWAAESDNLGTQKEAWEQKNFCAGWADMGPLIVEAKIGIDYCYIEKTHRTHWVENGDMLNGIVYLVKNKNPLRAAAIVYILVKQKENHHDN